MKIEVNDMEERSQIYGTDSKQIVIKLCCYLDVKSFIHEIKFFMWVLSAPSLPK